MLSLAVALRCIPDAIFIWASKCLERPYRPMYLREYSACGELQMSYVRKREISVRWKSIVIFQRRDPVGISGTTAFRKNTGESTHVASVHIGFLSFYTSGTLMNFLEQKQLAQPIWKCRALCLKTACLPDWFIYWQTDWLTDWPTDRLTSWLTDWLRDWMTDWLA